MLGKKKGVRRLLYASKVDDMILYTCIDEKKKDLFSPSERGHMSSGQPIDWTADILVQSGSGLFFAWKENVLSPYLGNLGAGCSITICTLLQPRHPGKFRKGAEGHTGRRFF